MKLRFAAAIPLSLFASVSLAAPTVSNDTISWPDDGWYQVQQVIDNTTVEVCQGGRSCKVSPGEYVVINLSTRERFDGIFVTGESEGQGVTVDGNLISWPDDGWYQVLSERDYSEVCGGARSCTVKSGSYSVINHTTGERFNNIVVEDDNSSSSPIVVTNKTISWPDDGWYQVQSAVDFRSLCEGGTSCTLPTGTYSVINHSKGLRWDEIIVGESAFGTTQVAVDITVPAYVSDELQVQLTWGDINTNAAWVVDESWNITQGFATDTEKSLQVVFSDRNGGITLGSVDTTFKTSTTASQTLRITADQFDTERWDNDGDGVSNLAELIAGTNPDSRNTPQGIKPEAVPVTLEPVAIKTFRLSWQTTPGAQYYRVLENADGLSGFTAISTELSANVSSFDHRIALYDRANAQYIVQSCNTKGCTDSTPVMASGTLDNAISYFKASNTDRIDLFGSAISVSADGRTLAIGAPFEASASAGINGNQQDNSASLSGAVYLFQRADNQWLQTAYVKASNADSNDLFGSSLSLSADGRTLAVGAAREDSASQVINGDQTDNSAVDSGAVYLFELIDSQWIQTYYLKASNGSRYAYFGRNLSLSADGNTLVTSSNRSTTTISGEDTVYIFDRVGDVWLEDRIETAATEVGFSAFELALSADGNNLVIGSPSPYSSTLRGSALVFVRAGDSWQYQAILHGDNTIPQDGFGSSNSLAISANGNTIAVGARDEGGAATGVNNRNIWNADASYQAGAVYLFQRSGEVWQQEAFIKASNTDAEDQFGSSVRMNDAGNILVVSAPGEHGAATGINGDDTDNSIPRKPAPYDGSGAAYLFELENGEWSQKAYIKASNTGAEDQFGRAGLAISGDGKTVAVGATGEDSMASGINGNSQDDSVPNSGAVYLY